MVLISIMVYSKSKFRTMFYNVIFLFEYLGLVVLCQFDLDVNGS
jgi:hypothetical protein